MPQIKCADKTIFILVDQGDHSVGILPVECTLAVDWEVNPQGFDETLHLLYGLNDIGWHGSVTAYVYYQDRQAGEDVNELKLQVEDYHPDRKPELTVRFI